MGGGRVVAGAFGGDEFLLRRMDPGHVVPRLVEGGVVVLGSLEDEHRQGEVRAQRIGVVGDRRTVHGLAEEVVLAGEEAAEPGAHVA